MTGTIYGYARVSSSDQSNEVQVEQLRSAGAENVIQEVGTGANLKARDSLTILLEMLKKDDTLMVTKLDRLSRSTLDTLNIMSELQDRGVRFVAHDIGIDTATPTGKFAMTVMSAVAELERTRLRERQREGIDNAKKKGKYKGRASKHERHIEPVRQFLAMGKGPTYIAETLNVSRTTVYKCKTQIEKEGQQGLDFEFTST
jgi:DNA invertase Pin-like site-specific DNA recombinase